MRRPAPLERFDGLTDTKRGLSEAEVAARRVQYGRNDIVEKPAGGWPNILRDTAKDPMIWFLIGTSGLFGAIGQFGEAAILMAAILPLVAMDMYLHRRTQASTRSLTSKLASRAHALRGGTLVEIPAPDLVPGDLVQLQAGEWFPADGLVLSGEGMQVDESSLSGEAFPVRKVSLTTPLAKGGETAVDTVHWGFAGTHLLAGTACVRLVYTGGETLYGEIVRSAVRGSHGRTPLQQAIGSLVSVLLVAAGVVCLALAWVRLRQGHGVVDAVLSAVTLAVAAIPEEFPVVFTFFLGVGVYRMAKRHALVRRGVAVENIGRVSCICSDKGNSRQAAAVRTQSRIAASIGMADVRRTLRWTRRSPSDVRPEGGARCVSGARRDLRGGR